MSDFLDEMIEDVAPRFKRSILQDLEAFDDHYVDWETKSGFPFLHITTREYYIQSFFEQVLEGRIRFTLIDGILPSLLINRGYSFDFLERDSNGFPPNVFDESRLRYGSNRECEQDILFQFIKTCPGKKIGYRYTNLPAGGQAKQKTQKAICELGVSEVVILDWSLQASVVTPDFPYSKAYDNISIRYSSIQDFFLEHLDEDIYHRFISFLQHMVHEFLNRRFTDKVGSKTTIFRPPAPF